MGLVLSSSLTPISTPMLTFHSTPRVLPGSHLVSPHYNLLTTSYHRKRQLLLCVDMWMEGRGGLNAMNTNADT